MRLKYEELKGILIGVELCDEKKVQYSDISSMFGYKAKYKFN